MLDATADQVIFEHRVRRGDQRPGPHPPRSRYRCRLRAVEDGKREAEPGGTGSDGGREADGVGVSPLQSAFTGDRADTEHFLRTVNGYYVYLLCRPNGTPFYVGKGMKRRAIEHELEAMRNHPVGESNPIKCNVIRKLHRNGHAILYQIDSVYDVGDQQARLEREAALIGHHRRLHEGGCLTNLAGGLGSMAGAAPFSLARHTATLSGEPVDNPERAILNRFLQSIGTVGSVPVKPISQLGHLLPTTPHPSPRQATQRNAYALIASATVCAIALCPGARIPRSFVYQGVRAIIENGVARDILKAGLATLVESREPQDEQFEISSKQLEMIVGLVGRDALSDRGLL